MIIGSTLLLILTLSIIDLKPIFRTRCFVANFNVILMDYSEKKKSLGKHYTSEGLPKLLNVSVNITWWIEATMDCKDEKKNQV